jgi:sarcosine oxidase gamma subunit
VAVLVVIEESASGIVALGPGRWARGDSGLGGNVDEAAIAEVLPERAVSPVSHEEVFVTVVIEVARAAAGAPTDARHAGLRGDIGERAVAIVPV